MINIGNKKIKFIDESYNASPVTMKICLSYFNELRLEENQKKILILGDMNELGKDAKKFVKVVENSKALFALTHNYTGYPMVRLAREICHCERTAVISGRLWRCYQISRGLRPTLTGLPALAAPSCP